MHLKPAVILTCVLVCIPAVSQQAPEVSSTQPQVKVNVLNVCAPSAEEQKEIASALGRIPKQPLFSADFEISHGRSTLTEAPNLFHPGQTTKIADDASVASYVRIQREFSVQALFSSVQYSFSDDGHNMIETLVFHVRDPKDLILVSMEDTVSSIGSAESMVTSNTPVGRIRLERFGKSSIALARCTGSENEPAPDQSAYDPLFRGASEVLSNYRNLLSVKKTVPVELSQVPSAGKEAAKTKASKSSSDKK